MYVRDEIYMCVFDDDVCVFDDDVCVFIDVWMFSDVCVLLRYGVF